MSNITTVLLIRHADIDISDGIIEDDSISLNSCGQKRAENLADMLEKAPISAIYTSNIRRAIETAEPSIKHLHSSIKHERIDSPQEIVEHILSNYKEKTVLVIHHSNTVPEIIQRLSNEMDHRISEFNDFYVVNIYTSDDIENKYTNVIHLKYGDSL